VQHPETTIVWLRDDDGFFPYALFSGDTDMATDGWVAFTSRAGNEVVLAYLTASELSSGDSGLAEALNRIHLELRRDDLFYTRVRFEREGPSGKGLSFAEFRQVYRPMRALYTARSGIGEAVRIREESLANFVASGGHVTVVSPNTSLQRTREG
jgi:hypothetical protein